MNDTAKTIYTDIAQLPYLNMALDELQEHFELNNIPSTNEVSDILTVGIGVNTIGNSTAPQLPTNLIEIQQLWESPTGTNNFTPLTKKEFIPHYLESNSTINQFLIWAWLDEEIHLVAANAIIDLKIDYIKSIFMTPLVIGQVSIDLKIKNCKSYLGYRTAALCSQFIGENKTRADELNGFASMALDRVLGIGTKGRQSIKTRRLPFRMGFKQRSF